MSNQVQGMDTEEVRTQAQQMDSNAAAVGDALGSFAQFLEGCTWIGNDRNGFKQNFTDTLMPQAHGGISSLQDNAHAMRAAADRQDEVSA
jgi:hypothetical protein